MKNKNLVIWILAIISTVSSTALVTLWLVRPAAPHFRPFHNNDSCVTRRIEGHNQLMKSLNLNEEQEAKFLAQRDIHRNKVQPLFDSIGGLREKLFNEISKEKPDTSILNSLMAEIAKEEAALQREATSHMLALKTFLEPIQVDSMISFYSKAMMPMGKGMCDNKHKHHDSSRQHCNSETNNK